jgi:hypothetical protein
LERLEELVVPEEPEELVLRAVKVSPVLQAQLELGLQVQQAQLVKPVLLVVPAVLVEQVEQVLLVEQVH